MSFLTRIPVKITDYSDKSLSHACGYFPLVGALIGMTLAFVYWILSYFLPMEVSITLTIIFGYMLTGGFHEDGLADVADGFGGAFEKEQKLNIMKDSRLGTYGALALVSLFAIKYQSLMALNNIPLALITAHCLSRVFATSIIGSCPYVTESESSKVKPVAQYLPESAYIRILFTATLLLLLILLFTTLSIGDLTIIVVSCFILQRVLIAWFKQQIQGYTGDCLGAAQQIIEVIVYCLLIILLD